MTNLVKAIDLRCPPIMQIHCLSWSPVKFLISSLITQIVFLLNLIKLVIKYNKALQKITDRLPQQKP